MTGAYNYSDFNNVAILRYQGAACEEPSKYPWEDAPQSYLPLIETNLHVSCAFLSDVFTDEFNVFRCPASCPDASGIFLFSYPLYIDF